MSSPAGSLWLADWSDSEDEDFRIACRASGIAADVVRSRPLGTVVGTPFHRLTTWPAYLGLAARGLRRAGGRPVVAWQPIAGAVAGLLRPGGSPPLVVLNPLLDPASSSATQRVMLRGLSRTDQVLFFSHAGLEAAAALGLHGPRLGFLPLGVRARRAERAPGGTYFLAAGREQRDWATLARAAAGLDADIRVVGPRSLPASAASLTVLPQVDRARFLELLEGAIALVVPLAATSRPAGQLAVLDALSVGRAVIATRGPGTVDYVAPETGILVPPRDPDALRAALGGLLEPGVADMLGASALEAARGPFSLERFVAAVDAAARGS